MLAVHWSPVKNTAQILRNGISVSRGHWSRDRIGVYCVPLSGFSNIDKGWANVFYYDSKRRANCNGFVFRVEEGDLPATFASYDSQLGEGSDKYFKNVKTIADIGREYRFQLAYSIAPLIAELNRDIVEFIRTRPGEPIGNERLTPQETDSFLEEMDRLHDYWVFNNSRETERQILNHRKPFDESESFEESINRIERERRDTLERYERYDITKEVPFGKRMGKENLEPQEADSFPRKLNLLRKIQKLYDLEAPERDKVAEEILAEADQRELSRAELNNPTFRQFAFDEFELILSRPIAPGRIIRVLSRTTFGRERVRKFRDRNDWEE